MNFLKASTKSQYALRLLAYIASKKDSTVSLAEVSKEEGISYGYLEEIVRPLKAAGILASKAGRSGGYTLAKDAKDINVSEIIEIFEGEIAPLKVLDGSGGVSKKNCKTTAVWIKLQRSVEDALSTIKLTDII